VRVRERAAARSGETGKWDAESLRELDKTEILSQARVKIVCVNQLSFKPVEIPEIIREKMENRT
jgi:acyl-CoA thioesterase FadM